MEVLWEAEKLMVKALVEALVIVPLVEFKVVIVPLVDQRLVPVRLVVEALVMVPVVDQKLVAVRLVELALVKMAVVENRVGAVRMEVEALTKLVCPETVRLPPRYVLPVEWTEKREPGLVVPIPTFPLPAMYKLLAADPLLTTSAALLPTVNPPVMVEVAVVFVTLSLLIQAVSLTVK